MVTSAFVKIWGELVGAVIWDPAQQLAVFEYNPSFISKGYELAPLKMPMNPTNRIYQFPELKTGRDQNLNTFNGLPGLLADSLPDRYGNQLINNWLARQGRTPESMNPVEKLCFIGQRGMGALEFEPATLKDHETASLVEVQELVAVASEMLEKKTQFEEDLSDTKEKAIQSLLRIGTSAGGARPKALIAYDRQSQAVRSGQVEAPAGFEQWLIKLDGVSDAQFGESLGYGNVEYAYHLMAKDAELDMMPSKLLEENGRAHFMTQRFDRGPENERHHVQTWCALNHFDYNDVLSYSFEQLFQTMRQLRLPYPAAEQMFRRMVFNVIARNCDDHTKNFAFMLRQGQSWELAPAYDVCHAYRPDSYWVSQHSLSINGKRTKINAADMEIVGRSMNIKKSKAIIQQINEVVKQWPAYAEEARVASHKTDQIGDTLQIF